MNRITVLSTRFSSFNFGNTDNVLGTSTHFNSKIRSGLFYSKATTIKENGSGSVIACWRWTERVNQ